ncbi:tetratricopeptide repeat protein [Lewinella sp. IMCC34191]|uniref:tetratricopeptide repeat protein n=1 Tax=Lewinella sp. IMCC34191 TaxID=2259172 RepID=UPI000E25C07D|nr:tetratricopeptide repeat protein [Lewinella sp. IMCC34191]
MSKDVAYLRQMMHVGNFPRIISRTDYLDTARNSPEGIEMLTYRAHALAALHRDEEAVSTYDQIIELGGQTAQLYLDKSILEITLGRFAEARKSLRNLLLLEPHNIHALRNLIYVAESCHEWQEVLRLSEKSLAIEPDGIDLLLARADAFRHLGQGQMSIKIAEQAMVHAEDEEDVSLIRTTLAWTYTSMKDWTGAEQELRSAIEAYDEFADSHFLLGWALAESGKAVTGLQAVERSFQLDPDNAYAYKVRAVILLKLGQRDRAIADLQRAKELDYRLDYDEEVDMLLQRFRK